MGSRYLIISKKTKEGNKIAIYNSVKRSLNKNRIAVSINIKINNIDYKIVLSRINNSKQKNI